jgi:hypothetical protein
MLNDELQFFEVFAVGVTGSTGEGEVGCKARICDNDIGSCVTGTRSGVRSSSLNEGGSVMWVRCGKSRVCARRKRD